MKNDDINKWSWSVLEQYCKDDSTDVDFNLVIELNKIDPETEKNYIFELDLGTIFEIHNSRKFVGSSINVCVLNVPKALPVSFLSKTAASELDKNKG